MEYTDSHLEGTVRKKDLVSEVFDFTLFMSYRMIFAIPFIQKDLASVITAPNSHQDRSLTQRSFPKEDPFRSSRTSKPSDTF